MGGGGGTGLLFVGRRVALACGSGAGARRGSRPEIAAERYARAEGAGGGRRGRQAGPGAQRERRARGRGEALAGGPASRGVDAELGAALDRAEASTLR